MKKILVNENHNNVVSIVRFVTPWYDLYFMCTLFPGNSGPGETRKGTHGSYFDRVQRELWLLAKANKHTK